MPTYEQRTADNGKDHPNWGGKRTGSGRKPGLHPSLKKKVTYVAEGEKKVDVMIPPKEISSCDLAVKKWYEIVSFYAKEAPEMLVRADATLLSAFCLSFARYVVYQKLWQDSVDEGIEDDIKLYGKMVHDETQTMNNLSDSLCLSPKSRKKSGYFERDDSGPSSKIIDFFRSND